MKKQKFYSSKTLSVCLSLCLMLFALLGAINPLVFRHDKSTGETTASSLISTYDKNDDIYIYSPVYSSIYNNNIYFIDEFDYMLKIYDQDKKEYKDPVSLEEYKDFKFNCAESVDSYLFLVISKQDENKLISINMSEDAPKIYETSLDKSYLQISASKKSENKFYLSLIPESKSASPVLMILDFTTAANISSPTKKEITLTIEYEDIENLFKILIQPSNENDATLILIYEKEGVKNIGFYTAGNFENAEDGITISRTPTFTKQTIDEFSDKELDLVNANSIYISSKTYVMISYKESASENETEQDKFWANIYNYDFPAGDNKWSLKGQVEIMPNVLTNSNAIIYSEGQTITYKTISADSFDVEESQSINNPNITISPFEENFEFYKTNKATSLLTSPWNYNAPICEIPANTDVICVATSSIPQSEYLYCLITLHDGDGNKNVTGFIKFSDLQEKEYIYVSDIYGQKEGYDYPQVAVIPKYTRLYTFPSSVLGAVNDINGVVMLTNSSSLIPENSKVEVIDVIYGYRESNDTQDVMLKVRVNYDQNHQGSVGYITQSSIIKKTDIVDFLVTNASVVGEAYVYQDKSESSTILDILPNGKNIKILEGRNNRDGFTYIAYNNAFGYECYGYIRNDFLVTDNWTTMQTIGCVLIAINIGLLILILIFKYKTIGQHGEKFSHKKEENKKQA